VEGAVCLSDDDVASYVSNALAAGSRRAVSDHLDSCERCRRLVSVLAGLQDTVVEGRARRRGALAERGTSVGRFVLARLLGEGAMGEVWAARDPELDREVAVKLIRLRAGVEDALRLRREAQAMARLNHPNVVKIYELGDDGGPLFIAMELLFGQSLWDLWQAARAKGMTLPAGLVAWIGARIATGLHHAHELKDGQGRHQELVHRDINPFNVFLTYEGEVKIIDFGLAKARNRVSNTATGVIKGKIGYLAPEQALGQPVDRRADLFALGTTLWELTTNQRLFRVKDDFETLKRILAAVVPDPTSLVPGYPPQLWAVLERSLARDPELRHPTAKAMAKDLDAYAARTQASDYASACARLMGELFVQEREHQEQWLRDATGSNDAPPKTLRPPIRDRPTSPPSSLRKPLPIVALASRSSVVSRALGVLRGGRGGLWVGLVVAVFAALAAFFAWQR
jgi:serine/threonine protein kinase